MGKFVAWVGKNADGVVALVLALFIAFLGLTSDDKILGQSKSDLISGVTLLVLGLLTAAILRDRWRQEPMEDTIKENFRTTSGALAGLPARLDRLERLEAVVESARRVLDDLQVVEVLNGADEIAEAHAEARRATDRWIFKGGTGTYMRAVTLPDLVLAARRERKALLVRLEIIDPTHAGVCEAYVRFRRSVSDTPDGTGEFWTVDRTRKESYATILAACWHRQRFSLLDIDLGLSSTMTTFRWDMSAGYVIITVEDPNRALMSRRGSFYYDHCSTELLASLDQTRRVPIEAARSATLGDEPTVDETRKLFEALGLGLPRSYTDRDVVEIIRKAIRAKNPY
ncbi:hypothetical protein Ssi03_42800 [Sphaerisporangium siamense]|uniref:Uncharacterized protein n=1 Tax=Sphaerisporangium siamense TaxID=795645 RepID=A0A7W7DER5_9ACTN|nr:hypothetical protein [Sphaerisporangium siamense]MBB4704675.1 hypothetical protein [Sphaerisporangium siamense]GII86290.1 hypothetical protein Ssi03_42800 [Sphaerisporangium siamense]